MDAKWINIPKAYTNVDLPVDSNETATSEKIKKWKYLQEISEEISQSDDVKVQLLIGANCPKALEPVQFIASRDGGPYVMKTVLGWCIVGPMVRINSRNGSLTCNRIAVQEAGSSKIADHYFAVEEQIKSNEENPAILKKIREGKFTEQQGKFSSIIGEPLAEISHDDQKFLKLMDQETIKVYGHYVIPLPLKSKDVNLRKNRVLALKRLNCLHRTFLKDNHFYEMYKTFVADMIAKGYARKADNNVKSRITWYIPHHGVAHPAKLGKVRVVFDCSVKYKSTSRNNQLISGPDLTNQLVGILTRFREEQLAFIADVEAMFHQARIPEDQRSLLRSLWWKNEDIRHPINDHEICVNLFRGISSPSCSNYALKRTSVDNEKKIGSDTARTLRRNLYFDDMLKSSRGIDEAVDLIQRRRNICKAGGFILTKFVSNKIEVMKSIPEEHCRKNINIKELESEEVQKERALGVVWNIKTDTFGFKISSKDKPATKKGMLSELRSLHDPLDLASLFILKGRRIIQKLCQGNTAWDYTISDGVQKEWTKLKGKLPALEEIEIQRCIKPADFGRVVESSIHHFSDASKNGYGQASYLRLVNNQGVIHYVLLIGKARVLTIKVCFHTKTRTSCCYTLC